MWALKPRPLRAKIGTAAGGRSGGLFARPLRALRALVPPPLSRHSAACGRLRALRLSLRAGAAAPRYPFGGFACAVPLSASARSAECAPKVRLAGAGRCPVRCGGAPLRGALSVAATVCSHTCSAQTPLACVVLVCLLVGSVTRVPPPRLGRAPLGTQGARRRVRLLRSARLASR